MAFNGLAKLGEECNEVGQVVCKAIQAGSIDNHHWSGDLRVMLEDELGDLLAAAKFVMDKLQLDQDRIGDRMDLKYERFTKWDQE